MRIAMEVLEEREKRRQEGRELAREQSESDAWYAKASARQGI